VGVFDGYERGCAILIETILKLIAALVILVTEILRLKNTKKENKH
jgi:hypothetical protein